MATALTSSTYSKEWGLDSRNFWTKRKKTSASLLAVMAMIAGIAVAFKLFDQVVPNNVVRDSANFSFTIFKMDESAGDTDFEVAGPPNPIFFNLSTYPGETYTVDVKLANTNSTPAKDATFMVYPVVTGVFDSVTGTPILSTSVNWARFVNSFTFSVRKEKVLKVLGEDVANEDDHQGQNVTEPAGDPDDSGFRQYASACEGGLREFTRLAPCQLGTVRALGSTDLLGEATDVRYYLFSLLERDDGSDQSIFKGWQIEFDLVFMARVPAVAESAPISEG